MPTTSPDAIPYPGPLDVAAPVEEWMEDIALTTQAGLTKRDLLARKEFLVRNAVPNGTTVYYLAPSGSDAAFSTPTVPQYSFNYSTGYFTLTSIGLFRMTAVAVITGSNGGTGAQVRAVTVASGGGITVHAASPITSIQAASISWLQRSDATASFRIEAAHNSGAARDFTGYIVIERVAV